MYYITLTVLPQLRCVCFGSRHRDNYIVTPTHTWVVSNIAITPLFTVLLHVYNSVATLGGPLSPSSNCFILSRKMLGICLFPSSST